MTVDDARLVDFLRKRGLCRSTRGLTVCESIIAAGAPIEVREYRRGGATLKAAT